MIQFENTDEAAMLAASSVSGRNKEPESLLQ
jgi:hypothetical protein